MNLQAMTSRTYSDANDLQQIVDLLCRVRAPERIADYPGLTDLHELLCLPANQANTRLWLEKGRIVAFALVDPYNNLLFEYQEANPDLQAEMVGWGVECVKRKGHEAEEPLTLDASCREEDSERVALLERHGFVKQPVRSLHLARPLREPIPGPALPAGFEIRPLKGRDEVEDWVRLHRAAFGTEHMTVEERLAMMSGTDYNSEIDLVMAGPDGRLAAYCMCQIFREENARTGRNEGYTDPVATHPEYQRRGLAKALLLTGLRLLQERGVETALMGTSSENEKMQRAAQAVGFRVESVTIWFAKPVSTITIRPYQESDAESVGRLIADTYSEFNLSYMPPEERGPFLGPFRHARSPEKAHRDAISGVVRAPMVYVAEDDGEVVGVLRGRRERLASLFVRGDRQRQGIGRRLVERFEQESLKQGTRVVRVAATLYGIPFYLVLGYRRSTGVRTGRSFEGRGLKVQPMRKVLGKS